MTVSWKDFPFLKSEFYLSSKLQKNFEGQVLGVGRETPVSYSTGLNWSFVCPPKVSLLLICTKKDSRTWPEELGLCCLCGKSGQSSQLPPHPWLSQASGEWTVGGPGGGSLCLPISVPLNLMQILNWKKKTGKYFNCICPILYPCENLDRPIWTALVFFRNFHCLMGQVTAEDISSGLGKPEN